MATGIYCITNTETKQQYVGSAVDLARRFYCHKSDLKCNRHKNPKLQASYNKYGSDVFEYNVLEECQEDNLLFWERVYYHLLNPVYNLMRPDRLPLVIRGEHHPSSKLTQDQVNEIKKLRSTHTCHQLADLFDVDQTTISLICTGKTYDRKAIPFVRVDLKKSVITAETREKMVATRKLKGNFKISQSCLEAGRRSNIGREPWNKGKKLSIEWRRKASEAAYKRWGRVTCQS